MHTTDIPPAAEERLREIASILAAGLLRLRTLPQLAAKSDMFGEPACAEAASAGRHVPRRESAESAQKALGLPAPARPDPHAG